MDTEEVYKKANDKIRAPEALKEETVRRMMEELALKKDKPADIIDFSRGTKSPEISRKSHVMQMAVAILCSAAVFFIAGRYLMPYMRTLPAQTETAKREDTPQIIDIAASADPAAFFAGNKAEVSSSAGVTLTPCAGSCAEEASACGIEETIEIGETTVYAGYAPGVTQDAFFFRAFFEKGGSVWMLSGNGMTKEEFTKALLAVLE